MRRRQNQTLLIKRMKEGTKEKNTMAKEVVTVFEMICMTNRELIIIIIITVVGQTTDMIIIIITIIIEIIIMISIKNKNEDDLGKNEFKLKREKVQENNMHNNAKSGKSQERSPAPKVIVDTSKPEGFNKRPIRKSAESQTNRVNDQRGYKTNGKRYASLDQNVTEGETKCKRF